MARGIVIQGCENTTVSGNKIVGFDESIVIIDSLGTRVDDNSIISKYALKRVPRETIKAILRSARKGDNAETISEKFGKYLKIYGIDLPIAIEKYGGTISMYGPPLVGTLKRIFSSANL